MANTITVHTTKEFRSTINAYAGRGFQVIRDEDNQITLSKRNHFNWPLAIVCLFIPILGWIALIAMIMSASRGTEVVEIVLDPQTA